MTMKKKWLFVLVGALVGTSLFASCGNEEKEVINNVVIDQNLPTEEEKEVIKTYSVTGLGCSKTFESNGDITIVDDSYYNSGLLIVKNKYGYIGLYSLHYDDFLVKPMFIPELIQSFNVVIDSNVGYLVYLKYKNNYYIWDSVGNLVHDSNDSATAYTTVINDEVYLTLTVDSVDSLYKYNTSAKLTSVTELPTEIDKEVVEKKDENEESLGFGDLFIGDKLDLTPYGLVDHYIVNSDNLYTVFNAEHVKVSTFVLPNNVNAVIVGGNIMYQEFTQLPDEVKDYSFSMVEGDTAIKANLDTYIINIISGEKKEIKCDYIMYEVMPYKDNNGVCSYGLALIRKIGDAKELKSDEAYLIDSEFNLVQNVTGYEVEFYEKLDNDYYYNRHTGVLYNNELVEVAYLGDMNPSLYEEEGLFIGRLNGKYGAVDLGGKVVIPFEYESLWPLDNKLSIKDNCIIASKYVYDEANLEYVTQYYRVNISSGSSTYIGKNVTRIYNDLYLAKTKTQYTYLSQSTTLSTIILDSNNMANDSNNYAVKTINLFDTKYVITKTYDYISSEVNEYTGDVKILDKTVYNVFNINPFKNKIVPYGTEITEEYNLGVTALTGEKLSVGNHELDIPSGYSTVYYILNMDSDYIYTIKSKDDLNIYVYDAYNNSYSVYEEYDSENEMYHYWLNGLEKDGKYYIHISNPYYSTPSHSEFEVYVAKHNNKNLALTMDIKNNTGFVNPGDMEYSYVYIPQYSGDSRFNPSVNYTLSVISNNGLFDVCYDSYYSNSYDYGNTSRELNLNEGPYYVKVYHTSGSTSDIKLSLTPTTVSDYYEEGETIQKAISLKKDGDPVLDSNNQPTYDSNNQPILEVANTVNVPNYAKRYYKYVNNNTQSTYVNFDIVSYRSTSTSTMTIYYQFYNSKFETIGGTGNYGSTISQKVFLAPKEEVYIGLYAGYSSYDAKVEIEPTDITTIDIKTIKVDETSRLSFSKGGTYVYKFKTDDSPIAKYSHTTYTNYCSLNSINYYDMNGNYVSVSNLAKDTEYYLVLDVTVDSYYSKGSLEYKLSSGVKSITSSYYYTPETNNEYINLKYTNSTSSDKYITISSSIDYSTYVYLYVYNGNKQIVSTSNYSTASISVVVPANTTYYIRTYTSTYNYEVKVNIEEPSLMKESNSLSVSDNVTESFTYRCEKTGKYVFYFEDGNANLDFNVKRISGYTSLSSISYTTHYSDGMNYYVLLLEKGETYLFNFINNYSGNVDETIKFIEVE